MKGKLRKWILCILTVIFVTIAINLLFKKGVKPFDLSGKEIGRIEVFNGCTGQYNTYTDKTFINDFSSCLNDLTLVKRGKADHSKKGYLIDLKLFESCDADAEIIYHIIILDSQKMQFNEYIYSFSSDNLLRLLC